MDRLNLEYKKIQSSYWHHHSVDVGITVLTLVCVFGVSAYHSYKGMMAQVRANWNEYKCSPIYLPFAGVIMPQPGKSAVAATMENFDYCIQQDFSMILQLIMFPLEMVAFLILDALDLILVIITGIMAFIAWLKSQMGGIASTLYDKLAAIVIPIYLMVLDLRDVMAKANAIMLVTVFFYMTIYNIMVSGLINVMNIIYDLLIAVIVIITSLLVIAVYLIPTPLFIEGIAAFTLATIALKIIIPITVMYSLMRVFILQQFNSSTKNTPDVPIAKKK